MIQTIPTKKNQFKCPRCDNKEFHIYAVVGERDNEVFMFESVCVNCKQRSSFIYRCSISKEIGWEHLSDTGLPLETERELFEAGKLELYS